MIPLENVSPASNVAIWGIYVTFQGCSYKVGSEITPHLWVSLGQDRCGNLIGNPGAGKGTGRSHGVQYGWYNSAAQMTMVPNKNKPSSTFDCNRLKCTEYHRISQSINSHAYTCTTKCQMRVLDTDQRVVLMTNTFLFQ